MAFKYLALLNIKQKQELGTLDFQFLNGLPKVLMCSHAFFADGSLLCTGPMYL